METISTDIMSRISNSRDSLKWYAPLAAIHKDFPKMANSKPHILSISNKAVC